MDIIATLYYIGVVSLPEAFVAFIATAVDLVGDTDEVTTVEEETLVEDVLLDITNEEVTVSSIKESMWSKE